MTFKQKKEEEAGIRRGLILSAKTKEKLYRRLQKDGLFTKKFGNEVYICEKRRFARNERGFACVRTEYGVITDVGPDDTVHSLRSQLITRDQDAKIAEMMAALDAIDKEKSYNLEEAQGEFTDGMKNLIESKNSVSFNNTPLPTKGLFRPASVGVIGVKK